MDQKKMQDEIVRLSSEVETLQVLLTMTLRSLLPVSGVGQVVSHAFDGAQYMLENMDTVLRYKGLAGNRTSELQILEEIKAIVMGNKVKPREET